MSAEVVLVDTNIISYLYDNRSLSERYKPHLVGAVITIAAQTVAELRFGAYHKNWSAKRLDVLERLLATYTVIHTNDAICTEWANLKALSYSQGRPMTEADIWIAATAVALDVPLVTHNAKDFDFISELVIISEA